MSDFKFLSRRRFLTGSSGVILSLPFLESIGAGSAWARQSAPISRFLCFHCSSGVETQRFWPEIGPLTAASFDGLSTQPLASYAERLLIPRGVHGFPSGTWTSHSEGTGQALTAAEIRGGFANGTSIDQVIARELTGRQALVLKPGGRDLGVPMFNSISYSAPGQLAAAESDPLRVYRGLMGFGSESAAETQGQAMQALMEKRKSVADLVRGELLELRSMGLSAADRQKLDRHVQLIRDVEVAITTAPELRSCSLEAGTLAALEGLDRERVEANENFPLVARLHVRLAALALACGYSRSTVLQWGAAVAGSPMYRWDGMDHAFRHHPLSHGTTGDFNSQDVSGYRDMLFEIDRWNLGEFRKLLDLLDAYDEGQGRTLLDNTVVLYTNEFSHGQGHTTGDLPYVVVGGSSYFRLGQSIVVDGSRPDIAGVRGRNGNSSKMLTTVLNAVGVPTAGFGEGPVGEFAELKA